MNSDLIRFKAMLLYFKEFKTFDNTIKDEQIKRYLTILGTEGYTKKYSFIQTIQTWGLITIIGYNQYQINKETEKKIDSILNENQKCKAKEYCETLKKYLKKEEKE